MKIKWTSGTDEELEELLYYLADKAFDTLLYTLIIMAIYAVFKKEGLL
jgi:hypothetical protein